MESFRTLGNDREASSILLQCIYASTAVIHNKQDELLVDELLSILTVDEKVISGPNHPSRETELDTRFCWIR
jgi:hypothetical protein